MVYWKKSRLRGLEIVWLRDRLEAFLLKSSSARLQLTDGSVTTVGYAGKTELSHTSIGKELARWKIASEWSNATRDDPVFHSVEIE